eukprot:6144642-Pleurochrysis_carterae.AAC.3
MKVKLPPQKPRAWCSSGPCTDALAHRSCGTLGASCSPARIFTNVWLPIRKQTCCTWKFAPREIVLECESAVHEIIKASERSNFV